MSSHIAPAALWTRSSVNGGWSDLVGHRPGSLWKHGGDRGGIHSATPCNCELPTAQTWERAPEGSCFRSAAQLGCWRVREARQDIGNCERVGVYLCSVTAWFTQMLYPPPPTRPPPGQWSLANVYSTMLQRFALHFQTSNFILIKTSSAEESPNRANQNSLCRPCLV